MIGRLRGTIVYKKPPELMLDVNGIGYELQASMTTFGELPEVDAETTLFTHFVVREDAQILYAFSSEAERSLFRLLLKVNGVGPKMALAIVSGMNVNEFQQCVQAGDVTGLTKLPGVGKKTAERLIIEMRDRLPKIEMGTEMPVASATAVHSPALVEEEAANALIALGYKPVQANRMVAGKGQDSSNVEEIIRSALKASLK
ncbi:MAG: Holliday junction DNA helicase RuvA [uncultured Thiotrichaceae bacterium]|uniref:Holliday junction branch migration complex subunit RuvA n=1 Tax=uncultured Thiotrichaceae bacterium TaxID=298394 RepID=A0A6S6TXS8_9GAMM|nr:MAG: Holliday junction DNA helicase RuvA [uncultured Thiotrichaceae bacterium]